MGRLQLKTWLRRKTIQKDGEYGSTVAVSTHGIRQTRWIEWHANTCRSLIYCLSLSPYRLGAKLRKKKNMVDLFLIVLKEPYFTRLLRHFIRLKWIKHHVGYRSNSTIVGNLC